MHINCYYTVAILLPMQASMIAKRKDLMVELVSCHNAVDATAIVC